MLTEIEWWGGLLIIWLVLCYFVIYKEYAEKPKFEVGFLSTGIAFSSAVIVLALYFYTFDLKIMQYLYLCFIGIGILSTVFMFLWPESVESSGLTEQNKNEDEEDIGKVYEIMGQVMLFFPIVTSFGLAFYKVSTFDI